MNIDFNILNELIQQVVDWMHDGGEQKIVPLGIRMDGKEGTDRPQVFFNPKDVGLILFALTNSEILQNACFMGMVKILAECTQQQRDELVSMLARFGDEMSIVLSQGEDQDLSAGSKVYYMRPGGMRS